MPVFFRTLHPVTRPVLLLLILLLFTPEPAKSAETITLTLPQGVLARVVKEVMPMKIDPRASGVPGMRGVLEIKNISALKIYRGGLSCRLQMRGDNLGLATNIGGQNLNLNIGSLAIDSKLDANLRFDPKKQILYLRPTIKKTTTGQQAADPFLAAINGNELPIALQPLQPIISRAGSRTVAIGGRIVDIRAENGRLRLQVQPTVSSRAGR